MPGLMQDWPLLCHRIMELAAQVHGHQEVVDFPRQINRENNSMNRNLPRSIREFRVGQLPAPSRYALILQKQTFVGGSTLIPVASNPPLSESFDPRSGTNQQLRRGFNAKRSCGFEIDLVGCITNRQAGFAR